MRARVGAASPVSACVDGADKLRHEFAISAAEHRTSRYSERTALGPLLRGGGFISPFRGLGLVTASQLDYSSMAMIKHCCLCAPSFSD